MWAQTAKPGSEKWNEVRDELIALDFTINPTLTIYEASRDLMREMNADWQAEYTPPALWQFFQPSLVSHGSYWHDWTTADEIAWKNNFRIWMQRPHLRERRFDRLLILWRMIVATVCKCNPIIHSGNK